LQEGFSYTDLLLGGITNKESTPTFFGQDDNPWDISVFDNMNLEKVMNNIIALCNKNDAFHYIN
jgi:hypothetical protein